MVKLNFGFRKKKERRRRPKIPNICGFPPSNYEELLASILEYMTSDYFKYPISMSLFMAQYTKINSNFKEAEELLNKLEFDKVFKFIKSKRGMETAEMAVGREMDDMIMNIDMNVLLILAREYYSYRPKQMPNVHKKAFSDQGFITPIDQSALDRKRLIKIMSEPTAIKKELQKNFEENQKKKLLKAQKQHRKEFNFDLLLNEMCQYETRKECYKATSQKYCQKHHNYELIQQYTKEGHGLCNEVTFSNLCNINKCPYIHYAKETNEIIPLLKNIYLSFDAQLAFKNGTLASQWINCDLRHFDLSILGKYDAIMLDPPWDIHMNLPYGTLKDKEMKALKVRQLMDNGVCFLWVTARALELGRECLQGWGYHQVEELVWIKTNSQGKIVRSGRTGHWLNHSKEHCLIGVKGDTSKINKNIDCDVLLSEVRETSRKPDEVYDILERMVPGGRKIELFARPHNRRKGWMSLGNQLPGIYLQEDDVKERFKQRYPELPLDKMLKESTQIDETNEEFLNKVYFNHLFKTNN